MSSFSILIVCSMNFSTRCLIDVRSDQSKNEISQKFCWIGLTVSQRKFRLIAFFCFNSMNFRYRYHREFSMVQIQFTTTATMLWEKDRMGGSMSVTLSVYLVNGGSVCCLAKLWHQNSRCSSMNMISWMTPLFYYCHTQCLAVLFITKYFSVYSSHSTRLCA